MKVTEYSPGAPCSIALLTDVHNAAWQPIADRLTSIRPDLICIAGDLFYGDHYCSMHEQTNVLPLLRACSDLAPTFFSFGNHDWVLSPEEIEEIRAAGVTVLDNEWVRHEIGESRQSILIGGLTSGITLKLRKPGWQSDPTPPEPETDWLSDFDAQEGFKLLLCHHPEYYPSYLKGRPYDLVLSGHAHGGQWQLFGRGLIAPGQGLFPKLTKGRHGQMIISRGLSNPTWIPRINNPTEIVVVR